MLQIESNLIEKYLKFGVIFVHKIILTQKRVVRISEQ